MKQTDLLACRRVIELLPWYANGSLAPGERQYVQAHLSECANCRREAEFCSMMIDAMPESRPVRAEAPPFSRLLGRINRDERQQRGWKMAAGVVLLLAALVAFALPAYLIEPRYQTVTEALPEDRQRVQMQVQLASGNNIDVVADLLERHEADLLAGPAPDGSVLLEFRLPDEESVEALRQRLLREPQIVSVREPGGTQ